MRAQIHEQKTQAQAPTQHTVFLEADMLKIGPRFFPFSNFFHFLIIIHEKQDETLLITVDEWYNNDCRTKKKGAIAMPYVTVKMLEGRTEEQKRALVEKVTEAVAETTGAPKEKIVVFIEEMSKNHYAIGGKRLSDES